MSLFPLSSVLVPLRFCSFKSFDFSAYSLELQSLSYATCKNYVFLLSNGILVIIVGGCTIETRRSGIAPSGPQPAHNDAWFSGHGGDFSNELTEERGTTDAEEKLPMAVKGDFLIQKDEIQDQGSELISTEATQDGEDNEAHGELSIEEFNRKCDNFIKKLVNITKNLKLVHM
ncbi:hypothetical protein BT93_H0610 [Corymbia citriodora subsp. variegata]|nr:hypothetical protein BT93_H0610 [Corymbia citriodora subsp. variegata]